MSTGKKRITRPGDDARNLLSSVREGVLMEREDCRFNERISIQKNEVVTDKYGNHKNVWTDYYSCFTYASAYQYTRE